MRPNGLRISRRRGAHPASRKLAPSRAPKAVELHARVGRRSVIGNRRQMGMATANQAAEQGCQSSKVLFAMPRRARLVELNDCLFYGTMTSVRVAHGLLLLTERSQARRSVPDVAPTSLYDTFSVRWSSPTSENAASSAAAQLPSRQ